MEIFGVGVVQVGVVNGGNLLGLKLSGGSCPGLDLSRWQ